MPKCHIVGNLMSRLIFYVNYNKRDDRRVGGNCVVHTVQFRDITGAQWLSGRVLNLRSSGRWFGPQ